MMVLYNYKRKFVANNKNFVNKNQTKNIHNYKLEEK